jgi:hypothetical protein
MVKRGDRNMKYFHRRAAHRAKKNRIKLLRKEDAQTTKIKAEMEGMTQEFFMNLYTADSTVAPDEIMHVFEPCISEEANLGLCKPFTDEEINDVLFQIGPLKVPRPDGFLARFFHRNWAIMKADVIRVRNFFQTGQILQKLTRQL